MKNSYDFVNVIVTKRDAEIISDIILREMAELSKMKASLEERGFSLCDIKCRQIDLKHLLETFTKAAE